MITYRPVTRYLCRRSHRPCPKGCARPHPSVQWYFCSPFENCINNGRLTKHIMIHCVSISLTDKSWFKIISVSIYILYNIYGSYKANHSQNQSEERHSGRSWSPKIHVRAHPPPVEWKSRIVTVRKLSLSVRSVVTKRPRNCWSSKLPFQCLVPRTSRQTCVSRAPP